MKDNLKKHITAALFAALTFAATMAVRIPTPGTSGYIHPGDALVILSGVILGPSSGFLAAGSVLRWRTCWADILCMCQLPSSSRG